MVPASALILTLCIGSFALASTSSHDSYSFIPPASSSTTTITQAAVTSSSSTTSLPTLQDPTVYPPTRPDLTTPVTSVTSADVQLQQAKENAILDLIREKMSADDKTIFDQLRAIAGQQQVALSLAQADLQATKDQDNRSDRQVPRRVQRHQRRSRGREHHERARTNSIPDK